MKLAVCSILAAVVLASSGCSGARRGDGAREVTVEAEGWGVLKGQTLLSAKHRALAEAQKKAVEKAIGVTVRARTRVEDALNVKQTIEANLGGTIRRYSIVSEGVDDEYYKVLIKATVLYRPGRSAPTRATRVAVRLPEARLTAALRTALADQGFPLAEDDEEADVAIGGFVETYGLSDARLNGFQSEKVVVSLSVADRRSGSASQHSCAGAALDLDAQAARDAALEQAGRGCALSLVSLFATELASAP